MISNKGILLLGYNNYMKYSLICIKRPTKECLNDITYSLKSLDITF